MRLPYNHYLWLLKSHQPQTRLVIETLDKYIYLNKFVWVLGNWSFKLEMMAFCPFPNIIDMSQLVSICSFILDGLSYLDYIDSQNLYKFIYYRSNIFHLGWLVLGFSGRFWKRSDPCIVAIEGVNNCGWPQDVPTFLNYVLIYRHIIPHHVD